jgi:hypothetical protein
MGDRYGSDRLEAACARALRLGNPVRKSVEAILKSGLDKIALPEEVEAKTITHENIRGGAYFDREETKAKSDEEIEACYLEEERVAIIKEPAVHRTCVPSEDGAKQDRPAISGRIEAGPTGPSLNAPSSLAATLPALLGRLQRLWAQPLATERKEPHDAPLQSRVSPPSQRTWGHTRVQTAGSRSWVRGMSYVVLKGREGDRGAWMM